MHFALSGSKYNLNTEVVAAVDISPLASNVYKHNFMSTNHLEKNLEGLSIKKLNKLDFNVILMSPPCQPFTRVGLKKDIEDPRSKSFLYLIDALPKLDRPPEYILLENVKGFEESEACKLFKQVLGNLSYHIQAFLLSPKQLGMPNSRLRYYIIARLTKPFDEEWHRPGTILDSFPTCQPAPECCRPLSEFLVEADDKSLAVSEKTRERYEMIMDLVRHDDRSSTCFTKAYGSYCEGTGSILVSDSGDLRYFSPREIANLMGFPAEFNFPAAITRRQAYRLLGNSLNVTVVSSLLDLLLSDLSP